MERAQEITGVGGIYAVLVEASSRPRYAFLVLQLVAEIADGRGQAGPFVAQGGLPMLLREWLCSQLLPMSEQPARRAALRARVAAGLKHELTEDAMRDAARIDAAVEEQVQAVGRANVSRAISDLVRAGLMTRHYAGYATNHKNRGGGRHAVYVVKPGVLALLRKPAPLRRQGPGAANPQGELFAAYDSGGLRRRFYGAAPTNRLGNSRLWIGKGLARMENEALLDHVADIVSAHVSNNAVAAADLPGLIQAVYASLAALGQAPEPAVAELKPAVSVRASVKPDAVTCLECGEKMKMLKRHLGTEHGLTPAEYRTRWSLPADYPMVAPDYAARRKELAVRIGLGRKPGQSPKAEANPAPEAAPKAQPKAAAAPAKRKKLGVAFGSTDAS